MGTATNFRGQFLSPLAILALGKATGGLNGGQVACAVASFAAALAFAPSALRALKAPAADDPDRSKAR